jgi:hypothetical protein
MEPLQAEERASTLSRTSSAGRLLDAARDPSAAHDLGSFIGRFEVVRLLGADDVGRRGTPSSAAASR